MTIVALVAGAILLTLAASFLGAYYSDRFMLALDRLKGFAYDLAKPSGPMDIVEPEMDFDEENDTEYVELDMPMRRIEHGLPMRVYAPVFGLDGNTDLYRALSQAE